MTNKKMEKYHKQLLVLAERMRGETAHLEEDTRVATGGDAGGNLSGAPMHLADLGTEMYLQEVNSALLENEGQLRDEVYAALGRIEEGTFGQCENCGQKIKESRLNVIPYARYCTPCAEELEEQGPNFNAGRPQGGTRTLRARDAADEPAGFAGAEHQFPLADADEDREATDIHAAGTPGGGTAVGGLGGTTIGGGDPADADLENAMGSGNYDVAIEQDSDELDAYSGPSGGAVGGTPAGKRARGGRKPR